jgi:male germ cell-associated kinase
MNRFNIVETIGEHSHGVTMKGVNKESGEKFIVKLHKKKFYTWEDCMVLREIKVLRVLNHTGI